MAITVIKEIMCEYPPLCKNTNKNLLSPREFPMTLGEFPEERLILVGFG